MEDINQALPMKFIFFSTQYVELATGKPYRRLRDVVDMTSQGENKSMVLYCDEANTIHVRELRDFERKFRKVVK